MPEEMEVPIEDVKEHIEKHHEHLIASGEAIPSWLKLVPVTTAILAVIAAVSSLNAGQLVNMALLEKNNEIAEHTLASDSWNYYQAKGIKGLIMSTQSDALPEGSPLKAKEQANAARYTKEQKDISAEAKGHEKKAEELNKEAEHFLHNGHSFSIAVSLSQIAIAMSAIAAITRQRTIWLLGMASGAISLGLLIFGFMQK